MLCAEIRQFRSNTGPILLLATILSACEATVDDPAVAAPAAAPGAACGPAGFVETELFGALAGKVQWNTNQADVHRDVAHLVTDTGGVSGVASTACPPLRAPSASARTRPW